MTCLPTKLLNGRDLIRSVKIKPKLNVIHIAHIGLIQPPFLPTNRKWPTPVALPASLPRLGLTGVGWLSRHTVKQGDWEILRVLRNLVMVTFAKWRCWSFFSFSLMGWQAILPDWSVPIRPLATTICHCRNASVAIVVNWGLHAGNDSSRVKAIKHLNHLSPDPLP